MVNGKETFAARSRRVAGLIMLGLALTMTGTVSIGAEAAGPPASVGKLAQGTTGTVLQDALETEDAAKWLRLDLVPGTYVAGRLAAAGPVQLDLVSEDGGHLRRLAGTGGTRDDFYFLVPEEATYLRASASPEGAGSAIAYRVEILRNLLPETGRPGAQKETALLSPRLRQLAATLEAGGGTDAFWTQVAETGTPLIETPQSVTVVTREQAETQGAQSVVQSLRYSAGVAAEIRGFLSPARAARRNPEPG